MQAYTQNTITTHNRKIRMIIHAVPFGYGPATTAGAIVHELRKRIGSRSLEIIGLCRAPVSDVFSSCSGINKLLEFRYSDFIRNPSSWLPIFRDADILFTVGDFYLAKALSTYNIYCYYLDVLYGIGMRAPILSSECRRIFLMNNLPNKFDTEVKPLEKNITVIDPIWMNYGFQSNEHQNVTRKNGTLLINLGGIVNPIGDPWPVVKTMLDLILEFQDTSNAFSNVMICGGDSRLMAYSCGNIKSGFLPHKEFIELIQCCEKIMTVPGLAVLYEAISLQKNPFILLPLNYSQYLQCERYSEIEGNDYLLNWYNLPGYVKLPSSLSDNEGTEAISALASRFAHDKDAQTYFQIIAHKALSKATRIPPPQSSFNQMRNGVDVVVERLLYDLTHAHKA